MGLDLVALHDLALRRTGELVAGIGADQWDLPTPCREWNVRELVNHVVSGNWWVGELARGRTIEQVGDRLDGDVLEPDPVVAYAQSAGAARAAFAEPGALEAPCAVSYGPVPGSVYAGHRIIDVAVHGWDIARATGQDDTLDPELVAGCAAIVEPQLDLLKGSGVFATDVEAPAGADDQTRLLAHLGRRA